MKIADRYILWNFLRQLILWYISLVGIYLILDLFQNVEAFSRLNGERGRWSVFFEHYFLLCTAFIDMVLPLLIVMAALGSLAMMIQRNEVLALMSIGVSRMRIICPVLIGALLLSFGGLWIRECYIPSQMRGMVSTIAEVASPGRGICVKPFVDAQTKLRFQGERYFFQERRIENIMVILPGRHYGLEVEGIAASEAIYQEASDDWPAGFLLRGVTKPAGIAKYRSIYLKDRPDPVVRMHREYPDSLPPDSCFVVAGIDPVLPEVGSAWLSYASTKEMIQQLTNPNSEFSKSDLESRIHCRILRPITDLFPLLVSIPLIFFRSDRNVYKSLAQGFVVAGLFIGLQYASIFVGAKFNQPLMAAWLPILLFGPIVINLFADLYRTH